MLTKPIYKLCLLLIVLLLNISDAQAMPAGPKQLAGPVNTEASQASWDSMEKIDEQNRNESYKPADNMQSGGSASWGNGLGSPPVQNQALQTGTKSGSYEQTMQSQSVATGHFANSSQATGESYAGPVNYAYNTPEQVTPVNDIPDDDRGFYDPAMGQSTAYGSSLIGGG
jgi:hypothetical protein